MPDTLTTAAAMIDALEALPPDMPVGFASEEDEIGGGYHITELKLAEIRSIDCGGHQSHWVEANLQLLDGTGDSWLAAGKVASILARSVRALAPLADAPLSVEFAHGNQGLSRFVLGALEIRGDRAVVPLVPDAALCKPAIAVPGGGPDAAAQCCGAVAERAGTAACCA